VNFWATWCKPCVEELPDFKTVQKELKSQPVVFLYVSLDFKSQLNSRVLPFLKKQPLNEALLLSSGNPDAWINRISPEWSGAIPATMFWKRGEKVHFHEGSFTQKELRQEVLNGLK
jgi:thiol-disulfide isomerase/thioredoxin